MEGDFGSIIAALQNVDFEEKLAALTGQEFVLRRGATERDDD
jgi:hypothetical protein